MFMMLLTPHSYDARPAPKEPLCHLTYGGANTIFVTFLQTKAQYLAWQRGTDCSEPHPEDDRIYKLAAQDRKQQHIKEIKKLSTPSAAAMTASGSRKCAASPQVGDTCRHRDGRGGARHSRAMSDCFAYCRRKPKKRHQQDSPNDKDAAVQPKSSRKQYNHEKNTIKTVVDDVLYFGECVKSPDTVNDGVPKSDHLGSCSKCFAKTPAWAKSENSRLAPLWLGERPLDSSPSLEKQFMAERSFNERVGLFEPHCAICSYFWLPERRAEVTTGLISPTKQCPQLRSTTWLPELIFAKEESFPLEEGRGPGVSYVLRCSSCLVTVHAQCYGVEEEQLGSVEALDRLEWRCDRCQQCQSEGESLSSSEIKFSARCALCLLRGGALKQCIQVDDVSKKESRKEEEVMWCHVTCALAIPKVRFQDVRRRSPIVLPRVTVGESMLGNGCGVCGGQRAPVPGILAKCSISKCKELFSSKLRLPRRCAY